MVERNEQMLRDLWDNMKEIMHIYNQSSKRREGKWGQA